MGDKGSKDKGKTEEGPADYEGKTKDQTREEE